MNVSWNHEHIEIRIVVIRSELHEIKEESMRVFGAQ